MAGNELAAALQPKVAAMIEDARADERKTVAETIAYEIRAELVCCDIYDRLSKERDERRWRTEQTKGHDLCYWGEAAARIAESYTTGQPAGEGER